MISAISMFSVFSRDSRLLIVPFSPLTLIDAIVISLFFSCSGSSPLWFYSGVVTDLFWFLIFSFYAG